MSGIHEVYLALALVFAAFITYMFVYNIRQTNRQKSLKVKDRPPVSREEDIALARDQKERPGNPGNFS